MIDLITLNFKELMCLGFPYSTFQVLGVHSLKHFNFSSAAVKAWTFLCGFVFISMKALILCIYSIEGLELQR